MTMTEMKMAPLEILEDVEREFLAGNYRKSSRLLWEATEATFRTLAKAHDLDPSDIRDVAIALDKKEGRRRYYRGKLLTGHFLRDHAEMDLVEDYELEEPHKSQPRFIRQCLQDLKADDARR